MAFTLGRTILLVYLLLLHQHNTVAVGDEEEEAVPCIHPQESSALVLFYLMNPCVLDELFVI